MTAQPRSLPAATRLLERFAELDGQLAVVETSRSKAIAKANASADAAAAPLLKELGDIQAALEPFWTKNAAELTQGKRKSIELGGCMIGSRASKASLTVKGDEKKIALQLLKCRWAKPLVRVSVGLNKPALLTALEGTHKAALAELGLGKAEGTETFYVQRAEQAGTLTP